jgi:hypothetical protein
MTEAQTVHELFDDRVGVVVVVQVTQVLQGMERMLLDGARLVARNAGSRGRWRRTGLDGQIFWAVVVILSAVVTLASGATASLDVDIFGIFVVAVVNQLLVLVVFFVAGFAIVAHGIGVGIVLVVLLGRRAVLVATGGRVGSQGGAGAAALDATVRPDVPPQFNGCGTAEIAS